MRSSIAIRTHVSADQRRAGQQRHVAIGAQPRQRPDQRLRFEDAGVRREQRRARADVRLASANERCVDDLEPLRRRWPRLVREGLESGISASSCATISFPQRA